MGEPFDGTENGTEEPVESEPATRPKPGFKVLDRRFWVDNGDEDPAAPDGAEHQESRGSKPTYVEQLELRAQKAEEKLAEYIQAYKEQVDVELVKFRTRLEREAEKQAEVQRGRLVLDLLEVLDNLDLSLSSADGASDVGGLIKGIALIREQFAQKLKAMGLEPIAALGERFDPELHEAVAVEPVDDPAADGKIVEEFKPGYLFNGKTLRPSMVKVAKKS